MTVDKRFLSRKFQFAVAAFLAGIGFFIAGGVNAEQWIRFTQWIVGLYMVGNVGDTAAEGLKR